MGLAVESISNGHNQPETREYSIEDRAAMDTLWNASKYIVDNTPHNYEDFMFLRAMYSEIKFGKSNHPVFDYRQWLKDNPYVQT